MSCAAVRRSVTRSNLVLAKLSLLWEVRFMGGATPPRVNHLPMRYGQEYWAYYVLPLEVVGRLRIIGFLQG